MSICEAFSKFVAARFSRSKPVEQDKPRCAVAHAATLLKGNPNPSTQERLDALRKGMEWADKDPYIWERQVVQNPGGAGFTVPFVKIGRRLPR
jgi:hypothetical protein